MSNSIGPQGPLQLPLQQLPMEVLLHFFSFFAARQVVPLFQLSRDWNALVGPIIDRLAQAQQRILRITFDVVRLVPGLNVYATVRLTPEDIADQWGHLTPNEAEALGMTLNENLPAFYSEIARPAMITLDIEFIRRNTFAENGWARPLDPTEAALLRRDLGRRLPSCYEVLANNQNKNELYFAFSKRPEETVRARKLIAMIQFAMLLLRKRSDSTLDRLRKSMIAARSIPDRMLKTFTMRELVLWVLEKKLLPLGKLIQIAKKIPDNGQTLCLLALPKEVYLIRHMNYECSITRQAALRGSLRHRRDDLDEEPPPNFLYNLDMSIDDLLEVIENLPDRIDFPTLSFTTERIKTKDQFVRYLALKKGAEATKKSPNSKTEAYSKADSAGTLAQLINDKEIRKETICRLFLQFMHMNLSEKKNKTS